MFRIFKHSNICEETVDFMHTTHAYMRVCVCIHACVPIGMPLSLICLHCLHCVLVNKCQPKRKRLIVGGALLHPLFEKREKSLLE